jgi:RNA polymerase sigma factor (sigma-70 family)
MGRLDRALQELPEEYRQVFVWRHVHGVSRVDIAEKLGKTPNAVSKLLGRATARLARELREDDGSA